MRLNHFSRRILASTAATSDWQPHLDFKQRLGALVDDLANLAVADGIAHADVHGLRFPVLGDWRQSLRLAIM